jgi:hypothetical protein
VFTFLPDKCRQISRILKKFNHGGLEPSVPWSYTEKAGENWIYSQNSVKLLRLRDSLAAQGYQAPAMAPKAKRLMPGAVFAVFFDLFRFYGMMKQGKERSTVKKSSIFNRKAQKPNLCMPEPPRLWNHTTL